MSQNNEDEIVDDKFEEQDVNDADTQTAKEDNVVDPKKPEDQTSELELQLTEEKGKRLQLMADFQNYQKRVQQEKSAWGALSNMALIQDLLEIFDDLELAMTDADLNLDHAKTSIRSAQDKLIDSALKAGVEKVEVKVGDDFDKDKMEAVSMVPSADDSKKGKVIAVISSAFKLTNKDGILRPAKVVVGK